MASGKQEWYVTSYPQVKQDHPLGNRVSGDFFDVGDFRFHVQLFPNLDRSPQPGLLYLVLVHAPPEAEILKIRFSFKIPELTFVYNQMVKDCVSRWYGGFGPDGVDVLCPGATSFSGDILSVKTEVEVLEIVSTDSTIHRWPIPKYEDIRERHDTGSGKGAFHSRVSERFEVNTAEVGPLRFRVDLHPNIDHDVNFFCAFHLEEFDPKLGSLKLQCDLSLEELEFKSEPQVLEGSAQEWTQTLGLAGKPTACRALRHYIGPLTVRLGVQVLSLSAISEDAMIPPPVHSGFCSPKFRYLILNSCGDKTPGCPQRMCASDGKNGLQSSKSTTFLRASTLNAGRMKTHLLESNVPQTSIQLADYVGSAGLPHPRALLEDFFGSCAAENSGCAKMVIYFTGHAYDERTSGAQDVGTWAFLWVPKGEKYGAEVAVSPADLFRWKADLAPQLPLEVIVEAPFAGQWCTAARDKGVLGRVLAAGPPNKMTSAHGEGSFFTDWLLGRGEALKTTCFSDGKQVPWQYLYRLGTASPMHLA